MDKDMRNKIVKVAKAENISVGEFIRRAITEALERNKELTINKPAMPFNRFFKPRS